MNTASFVKLTFDRVVRGKTVSSSRVVPASSVEFEVSGLLEKDISLSSRRQARRDERGERP